MERNNVKLLIGKRVIYLDSEVVKDVVEVNSRGVVSVASCSGHGKYHKTVFFKYGNAYYEYFSNLQIAPIKRRYLCYYIKDKEGFYYNPIIEGFYNNEI